MKTILLTLIALVSAVFFVPEAQAGDHRHHGHRHSRGYYSDYDRHHHRSYYRSYPRRSYYYTDRAYYAPRSRVYYYDEPRYYRYHRRPAVSISLGF